MPRSDGELLARWQGSIPAGDCTPLEFYMRVQERLTETEFDGLEFSEVTRRERGVFSARRIYLRIRCHHLFFDLSAFVAGGRLTVGYWFHADHPGIADLFSEVPGLRFAINAFTGPDTYFRIDLLEAFQHLVHDSILAIVDELSAEAGEIKLPDDDRPPVWEGIW